MRFGCCGSMVAQRPDRTGVEIVEQIKEIGYDYIELSLADMMALSEPEFGKLKNRVLDSGIMCEACNNFFPATIRLTGHEADRDRIMEYVERSLSRVSDLGVDSVVFGSAGARNVPEGFPQDRAWQQIVELLRAIAPIAERHGMTIVIEPLNRQESNIVNTVREGLKLAEDVGQSNVKLVADFYHLMLEQEALGVIPHAGDCIQHVHFSKVEGRVFPRTVEDAYVHFFTNLKRIGYKNKVSVEAYSEDFESDAAQCLALLRQLCSTSPT